MTRGRLSNHAFVVCEQKADEHDVAAVPAPTEVLARAIGRSGAEMSATELLRQELCRSEDLAVLMPILHQARAYVDARAGRQLSGILPALRIAAAEEPEHDRIARNLTNRLDLARGAIAVARDRRERLQGEVDALARIRGLRRRSDRDLADARYQRSLADQNLTWASNDATQLAWELRRVGLPTAGAAAASLVEAERAQARRDEWQAEHPTEAGWLSDLGDRVARRRDELAREAEERLPEHVVRLIGRPRAGTEDREDWRRRAAAIEAYRERWRVEPDNLGHEADIHGEQGRDWDTVRQSLTADPLAEAIQRLGMPAYAVVLEL